MNQTQTAALQIINELGADKNEVRLMIFMIVKSIGPERSLEHLEQARILYQNGTLVPDGSRPRTFGGCWISLIDKNTVKSAEKIAREAMKQL